MDTLRQEASLVCVEFHRVDRVGRIVGAEFVGPVVGGLTVDERLFPLLQNLRDRWSEKAPQAQPTSGVAKSLGVIQM